MCDCFHLAFPNWHGPATGAGRRLRGPEQDTEDDSVCEEPEVLEGERPRPQGSSPVEEFPTEKQAEEDINTSPQKSGSNKKPRKLGFGSLFDKRSSAKMSEDVQSGETEVIVKTVKETCAEGLIVTGGGKEGIFIKQVKPDSPASKHLTVKEGDQILSATVFFDNVSYEDALQILEHAQPYKMEFCLRRKVDSAMPEDDEILHPEDNERGSPEMRSPRKKKQQDRISWPKFPSFGKGHRAQFKRSHSTSEAEEHKKLEMSPPTSDTESPLKSPLKSPGGKDKKKKQKIKLKMKMKGDRSRSVEESQTHEKELTSENLIVLEDQQVTLDTLEDKFSEKPVTKLVEIPQGDDEAVCEESSKMTHELEHEAPSLSGKELQHKAHLISLGNTLKTADISDALAEASTGNMTISEEGKIERSEMKFSIPQKDTPKIEVDIVGMSKTSDPSAYDTIVVSHGATSQAEGAISLLDTDINIEAVSKDSLEKNLGSGNMEVNMLKLDVSVDSSGVGVPKQSPRDVSEKQWKEKTIFEKEIYGIRTRGPLADMAISKSHFASTVNELQFMPPDSSEMIRESNMPDTIIISPPQPHDLSAISAIDEKDPRLEIKTKIQTDTNIHDVLDTRSESKFKLPKVDSSRFVTQEPIKMTKVERIETHLPKREDIEIPGMEDKEPKPSPQTPGIKVPKIEKIINITKERKIQAHRTDEEFNVEDVKEAVSKFPSFKLPEGDITGVLVQREITLMELKADKTTPRGSPRKISGASADGAIITKSKIGEEKSPASHIVNMDTVIKIPHVEPPYADEQTITMTKIDYTKPKGETQRTKVDKVLVTDDGKKGDIKFKLPKREDIEIPGMESIEESIVQTTDVKVIKDPHRAPELQGSSLLVEQSSVHKTKKYSDKKGQEKKSKKSKISMPSFGITKPDIQFPDFGIELPKKNVPSKKDTGEIKETKVEVDVPDIKRSMPESKVEQKGVEISILDQSGKGKSGAPTSLKKYSDTGDQKTTADIITAVDSKTKLINVTEFDDLTITAPKATVDISMLDVQDTKLKLLAESPSADITCAAEDKEGHSVNVNTKAQEGQGRKFKLPKFEISLPEVKAPKITASKKEVDTAKADRKTDVPAVHGEMPHVQTEKEADIQEQDSKSPEMKIQRPTFHFPKFGFSKSESKEKEANVSLPRTDVSIPEGSIDGADITASVCDTRQKDESKFVSPTKFKLPSISVSKSGATTQMDISAVEVHVKGSEHELKLKSKPSLDAELKLPAEPPSVPEKGVSDTKIKLSAEPQLSDIKGLKIHQDEEMLSVDIKAQDIQTEGQGSKFKLPKFAETGEKDETKFTKFKLPSITLPKFGTKDPNEVKDISAMDVQAKGTEINLTDRELTLSVEPPSADMKKPDIELQDTSLHVDINAQGIQTEGPKFKLPSISLPKFEAKAAEISAVDIQVKGPEKSLPKAELEILHKQLKSDIKGAEIDKQEKSLSLPEVKGPKTALSAEKTEIDITFQDGKMEVLPPEVLQANTKVKTDLREIDSEGVDVNTGQTSFSFPKFGFSKSEIKAPEAEVSLTNVEVSLPEGSVDLEDMGAIDPKETKFGSPAKFKLPSITLPKFGAKAPKGAVDISAGDIQIKAPEVSVAETELKLSGKPLSVDIKGPEVELEESVNVDMKAQDIQIEEQGSKFKLPKFGISLPEVKGPKIDSRGAKAEIDISLPEGKMEVHLPDVEVTEGASKMKSDKPEIDSKGLEVKTKRPSFSFPKLGFSKSEMKAPEADASLPVVDVSLPEGKVDLEGANTDVTLSAGDTGQKDETKFGSPTKFKLPSITLPKLGAKATKGAVEISAVDVQAKGPEISLPDTEVKLSTEPLSVEMKGEMKAEIKAPDVDLSVPIVDVSVTKGNVDLEGPSTDIKLSMTESEQKDETKFGSPTKFKLPSISLPKIGVQLPKTAVEISAMDVQSKGPEISLPDAGLELPAVPPSVDMKGPEVEKEISLNVDVEAQDFEGHESKFKLPKFGISLPEVKGPKIGSVGSSPAKTATVISLPEGQIEVQLPDTEIPERVIEVKAEAPDVDSKGLEVKTKRHSFSFPKFGFSKSEVKAPEADASLPHVDVSLAEGSVDLEGPKTEITATVGETGQKDKTKFGSPTKFKLPSISLPKLGAKAPKVTGEITTVNIQAEGPEISLPEAELKFSTKPLSVDIKQPELEKEEKSLSVDMKSQDIQIEDQGKKFKLPTFGISIPEVKGPKIDPSAAKTEIDISLPEGKKEVHLTDVEMPIGAIEAKANVPEIDSKGLDVKTKRPSFSFPKFGFSKSEMKTAEADVGLPNVDVSLPEVNVDLKGPNTEIPVSVGDDEKNVETKFGSPTKFKLPTISLPKFGAKAPKGAVEISTVDVQAEGHDISLPEAELKLSAEPLSVDIKGPHVELEGKTKNIQTEEQGSKFKLPKFGISLPEVKGPKISAAKTEIDVSLPQGKMELHPPDTKLPEGTFELKADVPEIDSEGLHVKTKGPSFSFPKFGFSKSEMKAPEADTSLPVVDVSLPEGKVDLEGANTDVTLSAGDTGQKDETKFGSPTKFKLPSISFPKFGSKAPKGKVDIPAVDVQAKGPEIILPGAEVTLSAEVPSVNKQGPDVEKEAESLRVDVKTQDIQIQEQGSKFKLPKFGISLPEVKGPKVDLTAGKTEVDISLPQGEINVHPPDPKLPERAFEVKADIPEIDSKGLDVKTKGPSFSFPKIEFSKSEMKAPEADASLAVVEVSLPEGKVDLEGPNTDITVSVGDTGQKDDTGFGSPTKFKLPSISLPKFGIKGPKGAVEMSTVDIQAKGHDISLPEAELKMSAEPLSVDIKGPDVELEKSLSVDMKAKDIHIEEQGSKFKLPKFGISLPEVKGPKIDTSATKTEIDVSLPEGKMEMPPPDAKLPEGAMRLETDIPQIDSKDLDVKTKGLSFTFPKFGFSKSEMKAPEVDASLPDVDVSLPEGNVDLERPNIDITLPAGDTGQKDETKFGSPTKFKLPTITLPKFGAKAPKGKVDMPSVDLQAKGPGISLPEAELKLSAELPSVDKKGSDVDKVEKALKVDMKAPNIETEKQGSKFKLPKFGISLPEVKGPKIDSSAAKTEIDISLPEGKIEVHPPDTKLPENIIKVKADVPEIDSKGLDVKTKGPSFSFPKFGFSKSEMKAPEVDASLPVVDVSLPEGKVDLDGANADITVSAGEKDERKFGSPTKFKLPTITLPKFGAKPPKGTVEISAADVPGKGHDISLPEAELKLSAEPLSVDVKGPEVDIEKSVNVDIKAKDIQIEEQGSKFKLPKFGISLPEVQGPKIGLSTTKTEIDISLPEGKMEVHPPDTKLPENIIKVKADVPEIDSQGLDVKTKGPSFSFPKFGFSKSEMKAPEVDASLPVVDVSLPEGKVDLDGANADITLSAGDTGQKDERKFGSPTKFKLPTISLPKFGAKPPKGTVEISTVDVPGKGHDISLPEAELKLSAEPLSVDVKGPEVEIEKSVNVDIKAKDIQIEEQGSKFKLPKFGISLPEVQGPKIGLSTTKTETDVSLPEGKMEMRPPHTKLPEGAMRVETDIPEIDSKGLDVKTKGLSFTFPKFGFSKSEMKAPEADASLPVVDVSLPEGNVNLEGPKTDITVSVGDTEQKDETKFGSPTKFKLPSISLPKFGAKAPKGAVEISTADIQGEGHDISLPEAKLKLSAEPLSVDIKGSDVKLEESLSVDMKAKDIQTEEQGSKFKLPKFGINLPEVKGPKIDLSAGKTEIDVSLPEGKMVVSPPDTKLAERTIEVKADIPEIDSEGLDVKTKGSSFSFPKFGFSKSEMKAPEADASLPVVDVSLPEGNVDLKGPNTDITVSMGDTGQKDETKFGSPTKFKLPSISLPKFGVKASKGDVEMSTVDIQAKGHDISLPEAELKMSAEPLSVDIKGPDVKLEKSLSVDKKAKDIHIEEQGSKFKLPKFGISLPEVKGPKIDTSATKTEIDVSLPEGKMEMVSPDIKLPEGAMRVETNIPQINSKDLDVKTKGPSFTFPKFGFSKSEMKAPEVDASVPVVDVSLPEGNVGLEGANTDVALSAGDTGQKDKTKFGSPTKFKLPTITLPKFGAKAPKGKIDMPVVDIQVKGHDISLPDTELELSAEPVPADVKVCDITKEETSLSVQVKAQNIPTEEQGITFKLPKFGISLPEVKGPKIASVEAKKDIALPEGKMEVHPADVELPEGVIKVKADIPEIDSKGLEVKTKRTGFSFPKFGFSKSQTKASETDVSLQNVGVSVPEGSVHLEGPNADTAASVSDREQKDEAKFGSPTKFKLPSISLPKFGAKGPKGAVEISTADVQDKGRDISLPEAELKLPGGALSVEVKESDTDKKQKIPSVDMKAQDVQPEGQGTTFKLPKFGISLPEVKGTKDANASKMKFDVSLPAGKMEVHPPDTKLPEKDIKLKADIPEIESKGLEVMSSSLKIKIPSVEASESKAVAAGSKLQIKPPEVDVSLLKADSSVQEGTTQPVDIQFQETKYRDSAAVTGSPIKFKLPTFKMPSFGKTSETSAEISTPEKDIALSASDKHVKLQDSQVEVEIKDTIQKPPETAVKKEEEEKGSPSRFKLPTIKMSKITLSKTKSQDGDSDTNKSANVPEAILEPKHKKDTKGQEKSSKFTIPTLDDVLRGFDVEFNVPALDETEGAKPETAPVKLGLHVPSKEGDKKADSEAGLENIEKQTVVQTDQKLEDEETKPEKGSWFRFPKFSSPTKTAKVVEKESSQPPMETVECSVPDNKEKEPELNPTKEIEVDSASPTLSLRSSDAFADVSSAQTTEQLGLSLESPTKVKVKYSESTATVEISDLHGDVITSTARSELISMEPHQPEKVNIPCSSEMSSTSVDTLRQMSGEIHVIVSNVQTVPGTQRTTILTDVDTQDIPSLALEGVAMQSDSVVSVKSTRLQKEEHTVVERHIVKEMFGDDKEKVFVTTRMQVFEGDSVEPISDETASSIQKLRDTVHTEKMKFFESAESSKQNLTSNEKSLRHIDSSTEENEGK